MIKRILKNWLLILIIGSLVAGIVFFATVYPMDAACRNAGYDGVTFDRFQPTCVEYDLESPGYLPIEELIE